MNEELCIMCKPSQGYYQDQLQEDIAENQEGGIDEQENPIQEQS